MFSFGGIMYFMFTLQLSELIGKGQITNCLNSLMRKK